MAKLTNVAVALAAMKQVQAATSQMPRIAVLSGPPGYGKTQAAAYLAHPASANAVFIQLRPFETMKSMAQLLLTELDVRWKAHWPVGQMFDAICERFNLIDRPLVIDEFDHVAEKNVVEFVRSLHDKCSIPIFLIGEERLQQKLLARHERFHDRVLVWARAVLCDLQDAQELARHYTPQLTWQPGAMQALVERSGGVARRVTTELDRIKEECKRAGVEAVTAAMVGAPVKGARR
ncbi:MAG: ATP-binding protein [Burkholderiales bacterium]|nr:ATP-binding protein [Burkholderiales bacterium]